MKTFAFYNAKGGVGKTSSAVNVAYILAAVHNKRTLLIDLDPQSNATDFYNCYDDSDTQLTVEDLLAGTVERVHGVPTPVTPADVIQHTAFENLDLIPANLSLGRAEKNLMRETVTPQQFKLANQLCTIRDQYDYCILDCSPSLESLVNINGLAVADAVFVPLKCDKWASRGLDASLTVINTVSTYNYNLQFGGCFYVQWEERKINRFTFESLQESLGDKMLNIKIRKNKSVEEETYCGEPLLIYDPKGTATLDYLELTQKIIEIMDHQ